MNLNGIKEELHKVNTEFYIKYSLKISDLTIEKEGQQYNACRFKLNQLNVVCRKAKMTPKKTGQFVTFWKRNVNGITKPFNENDAIDYFVVNVHFNNQLGQFVFPKSILIAKRIISTATKEGKRGFRIYPSWDVTKSKQAIKTQQWQLDYFWILDNETDFTKVKRLYLKS